MSFIKRIVNNTTLTNAGRHNALKRVARTDGFPRRQARKMVAHLGRQNAKYRRKGWV